MVNSAADSGPSGEPPDDSEAASCSSSYAPCSCSCSCDGGAAVAVAVAVAAYARRSSSSSPSPASTWSAEGRLDDLLFTPPPPPRFAVGIALACVDVAAVVTTPFFLPTTRCDLGGTTSIVLATTVFGETAEDETFADGRLSCGSSLPRRCRWRVARAATVDIHEGVRSRVAFHALVHARGGYMCGAMKGPSGDVGEGKMEGQRGGQPVGVSEVGEKAKASIFAGLFFFDRAARLLSHTARHEHSHTRRGERWGRAAGSPPRARGRAGAAPAPAGPGAHTPEVAVEEAEEAEGPRRQCSRSWD